LNKIGHFENNRPEVRAELQTTMDAVVIVQVSRMEAWKGQASLLEALGRLRERRDWTCWIAGGAQTAAEASYAASLKTLAASLGIADRVRFLGERADVPRILAAADIFCQPNKSSEGFSIVFMEAFLASLPIVTTAIGGAVEMVNDSCGVLLPMDDTDALTESLRTLIEDPRLREALGDAGRKRVYDLCDPQTQICTLREILAPLAK
jgi:glycosyltransferase involved in cell wall biosynthesis